ncbi:MAG: NADH-quinone oxidoreductase subunit M [Cytophagales bacterium]
MYLLSLIIFLPICTIPFLLYIGNKVEQLRIVSLITFVVQLLLSLVLWKNYDSNNLSIQFVENINWIHLQTENFSFISNYKVGIDGLNLALVVLSSFIFIISVLSSWKVSQKPMAYFVLLQILACTTLGCFLALDLFVFFVFFEFMLLPMYFLIAIWGGVRREYAAIKFFLFTLFGSLLILLVFIWLYLNFQTFDIIELQANFKNIASAPYAVLMFFLLFIGLSIKLPSVPVHTWLPDAHVEASTPISVILAALLLKTGGYAIIRICLGIFPQILQEYSYFVAIIGVISIVYAAFNALAMNDLKKMIAYSSVSHMGFVLLGIAACNTAGINGAIFQMVSHGIISAALFLVVGVIYERVHNRSIDNFRGLAFKMPNYTLVTSVAFFASLGLPGFSGFIGEILVLMGAFDAASSTKAFSTWLVIAACFGILLSAAYYLWTLQRMFFGKYWLKEGNKWSSQLNDLTTREKLMLFSLAVFTILLGVYPNLILKDINQSVELFVKTYLVLK